MSTRVGSTRMSNNYLRQLNSTYNQYTKLMEQSDGSKLHRASDDSQSYAKMLRYQNSLSSNDQYQTNVSTALSWMNNSDSVLVNVSDNLSTFKEKVVQASNSTNNESDLHDIAKELLSLVQETVQEMNTQMGDRYLFSGQSDTTLPFNISSEKMDRGLTKTLDDNQEAFFNNDGNLNTGTVNQFLVLDGDDGNSYYLDTSDGSIYTKDFVESGYKTNISAGQEVVDPATDRVASAGGAVTVSNYFNSNGTLKDAASAQFGSYTVDGNTVTMTFSTVSQYVVSYAGDDKYISMVTKNGATNPSADTVNQTGQDVFGSDIFDSSDEHQTGTAMLNELLAVVSQVDSGDYIWTSSDGITVADKTYDQVLGAETTMAARNQSYQAIQTMLTTQNESITSDLSDVESTDVAELATKLMEYQTIYSLSLSVGSKILPGTLADYL